MSRPGVMGTSAPVRLVTNTCTAGVANALGPSEREREPVGVARTYILDLRARSQRFVHNLFQMDHFASPDALIRRNDVRGVRCF